MPFAAALVQWIQKSTFLMKVELARNVCRTVFPSYSDMRFVETFAYWRGESRRVSGAAVWSD